MEGWTFICGRDELAPGEYRVVDADGTMIAVFNIDGDYYAIEDVCTHDGAELTGGPIHGFEVECPRHGSRFDVRTGAACNPPAYLPTASFPIRIDDAGVWSRDDRFD